MKSVYDRLHVHLLNQEVIHADETTAQVLHEDGKTPESKSYIWLYTSGAFEKHRIVIYEYQPTRGGYHTASSSLIIMAMYTLMDSVVITA